MVVAPPAPHQPWDADPKYEKLFDDVHASDYVPKEQYNQHKIDGHWLLRAAQNPMSSNSTTWADKAFRGRWATLKSVDDMVEDIYNALKDSGKLDETFIIFTSDHGYHTGQFRKKFERSSVKLRPVTVKMVKLKKGCRISYLDYAILQPTKIKLV